MTESHEAGASAPLRRIGLFVDLENLSVSGGRGLIQIDPDGLLKALEVDEGGVAIRRAYADWSRLTVFRESFLGAGFEQVQATHVSRWKNDLDMIMALDALEVALTDNSVETVALASSDVDFAPLVRVLRRHGRRVIGLGWASKVGDRFREQVDRFIALEDVLGPPQIMDRRPARGDRAAPRNGEASAPERRPSGPILPDDAADRVLAATILARGPGALVTFGAVRQAACRAYPDRPPQTWSKALMIRLFEGEGPAQIARSGGAEQLQLPLSVTLHSLPLVESDGAGKAVLEADIGFGGERHAEAVEAAYEAAAGGPVDPETVLDAIARSAPDADGEGVIAGLVDSRVLFRRREDGALQVGRDMDDVDTARYAADAGLLRRAMTASLFLSAKDWALTLDGDDDLAEDFAGMLEELGFCDPAFGTPKPAPVQAAKPLPKGSQKGGGSSRPAFFDPRDDDPDEVGGPSR